MRASDEHLGGTHDDLLVAAAAVVALADDQGEQDDAHGGAAVLGEHVVGEGGVAGSLVHESGVEGDGGGQLARVVVLGLQRREHHVLGALGAHLDGEVDGLADDASQLPLDLVLEVRGRGQDLDQDGEDGLHDGLGVLVALVAELGTAREERQRHGAPLADGVRGADLEKLLLERLELLALLAVHAEEVAREDELPDHGHGHAHEDVAPPHAVAQVCVDVGAVQHGVVQAVDYLLVVDLRDAPAGAHVAELAKAEHPLLHVGAKLLAPGVEVVDVLDGEEVGVGGAVGGEDLLLHLADPVVGGLELRAELGNFGILLFYRGKRDVSAAEVVELAAGRYVLVLQGAHGLGVLGLDLADAFVVLDGDGRCRRRQALIDLGEALHLAMHLLQRALEGINLAIALGEHTGGSLAQGCFGVRAGFGEHAILGY